MLIINWTVIEIVILHNANIPMKNDEKVQFTAEVNHPFSRQFSRTLPQALTHLSVWDLKLAVHALYVYVVMLLTYGLHMNRNYWQFSGRTYWCGEGSSAGCGTRKNRLPIINPSNSGHLQNPRCERTVRWYWSYYTTSRDTHRNTSKYH